MLSRVIAKNVGDVFLRHSVVKLFLDHKADVYASIHTGATLPYIATQNGHTEVVKLFKNHKIDVDARPYPDSWKSG